MQTIHNYILFPENLYESIDINNSEKWRSLIKDFQMTIDLADCEKSSLLYYSKSNKDNFFDEIKDFDDTLELNIGSYDFETFVNLLFQDSNIKQVNENPISNCKISIYNSTKGGLDNEPPILFNGVINQNLNKFDKQIVLNLFNSYFSQNPIMIIIDCTISNGVVNTIKIPFVIDFFELDNWLIENRIKRNFDLDDNRHIENHPKSRILSHGKSPLIGGLGGKKTAEELLKNAIGDKKTTSNNLDLMNFDDRNNAYIWYEYENANNQYHAYHLVKAFTHENDIVAISRIPHRVLNIIEYRKSQ